MPKPLILSEDEFRTAAKDGQAPADAHLRKAFVAECKAIDDGKRAVDFVISTASVDRMGDTIAVDGWKLEAFRKNPVVLWAHDASMLPVAKASNVRIEDGKLKARAEFAPKELSGMANAVYEMIKAGFLSATSVGFAPLKYAFSEEAGRKYGIDFMEQELLEFSIVPIPANADALIEARAKGIDLAPLKEWVGGIVAASGDAIISKARLDAINALPVEFRSAAKKIPDAAKGARGQLLRCANMAEKAITGSLVEPRATPALDRARQRMSVLRSRA